MHCRLMKKDHYFLTFEVTPGYSKQSEVKGIKKCNKM